MRAAFRLAVASALLLAAPAWAANRAARTALKDGVEAYNAGDLKTARSALTKAVKADPKYGPAHVLLARILIRQGDGVGAERQLRRAVFNGYPAANVRHLLGHALLLLGRNRDAFLELTKADIPLRYRTYAKRIQGRIHTEAGEYDQARVAFDQALKHGPYSTTLWSDIGRYRFARGDVAGAVEAVGYALQLDEGNVEALTLGGELTRGQYGLIMAMPWFERALEFDPDYVPAMLELAATLGDAGRARDMLAMTRRALAVDGRNAQAFYLQAVLAARAGKHDLARNLLYRTGERLDNLPSVILLRAVLDIHADNDAQAIIKLKTLTARQPGNIKARRLLGAAYARSGDHRSAVDVLRAIAMRADADSYTLTLIGRSYEQLDERKEAAWFLDRAARPDRGEATPFEIPTSLSILARANAENPNNADAAVPYITQLVANGQTGAALAEAQRLQRLNPGAPAAHILVGDSLMAQGRFDQAVEAYKRAANIRFSEGTALRMVKALNRAGNEPEAIRVLDLYLGQNPRSVAAMMLATDHFMANAQWDRAIAMLERVRARIGNRDATVLNNLAWCYLGKGDGTRGIAYAKAAFAMAPANAAVSNTYGWALFSTGYDRKVGLALLEKAAAKAPNHPGLQYRLGQAYAQTGRTNEARRAIKAAMASPEFPARAEAKLLLAKL